MQTLARNLSNSECSKLNKTRGYCERQFWNWYGSVGGRRQDPRLHCADTLFLASFSTFQTPPQTQGDVIMYGALSESHPQSRKETLNMSITGTEKKHCALGSGTQVWNLECLKFSDISIYFLSAFGQISNSLVHFSPVLRFGSYRVLCLVIFLQWLRRRGISYHC